MHTRPLVALLVASLILLPTRQPQTAGVEPSKLTQPQGKITPDCRKSIDRGMRWLKSCIRADGMVGVDIGQPADLSCTSMVGLALLAQGNTRMGGPQAAELRRVLDGVLNQLEKRAQNNTPSTTVTLVQRKIGRNADLFLAALFLSQILGESGDAEEDVRAALEKLVAQICSAQGKDGTWGDESWAPVLGTVLGWESLRASSSSGLAIDASAQLAGDALLKKLKTSTREDQQHWMHEFYKNASSIRVLYSLNYRDEPVFKNCVDRILRIAKEDDRPFYQAGGEEYLAFFLVTECLLQDERNESWQTWYPTVRDKLIRIQNTDGSWSGHHCITARTFCTAAALLTLQAQNLYLPASNL